MVEGETASVVAGRLNAEEDIQPKQNPNPNRIP